jgi:chromosome partitioning protein
MPVIVVANPKGGVGKSTMASNIAGWFASQGFATMLGDADRQLSASTWLSIRPATAPRIAGWEVAHGSVVKPPKGTTHLVLDTPAGLKTKRLDELLALADKVLVPLQASLFDMHATHAFLVDIVAHLPAGGKKVAAVGNRIREGTISADQLASFARTLPVPMIATLRDTQNYVHLAARGLSLWDIAPGRIERDLEQWQPILDWLEG